MKKQLSYKELTDKFIHRKFSPNRPTVNSLSGGRTSSYIAANYPADIDIFSIVCLSDHNANGAYFKNPEGRKLQQIVNDKLGDELIAKHGEFISTPEDPSIIKTMLDLEQLIGRKITWTRGISFDEMIQQKQSIPNQMMRYCTYLVKILPIFLTLEQMNAIPNRMRIGYRADEFERMLKATESIKIPRIEKQYKNGKPYWQHEKFTNWRENEFVLIRDQVFEEDIIKFWSDKNIQFATDSNCQFCFWKTQQQLRQNFETNKSIMLCAAVHEDMIGHSLNKENTLLQIKNLGLQLDAFGGIKSAGCQAGFCTD